MFVFILSKDKVTGQNVKEELQEVLGQIGKINFQQIDPDSTEIPHQKGDTVSIFPSNEEREKVEQAIKGREFSMKVIVVKKAQEVPDDSDSIFFPYFDLGEG